MVSSLGTFLQYLTGVSLQVQMAAMCINCHAHAIPAFEATPECMDLCSVTVRLLAHKNKSENGTMYI